MMVMNMVCKTRRQGGRELLPFTATPLSSDGSLGPHPPRLPSPKTAPKSDIPIHSLTYVIARELVYPRHGTYEICRYHVSLVERRVDIATSGSTLSGYNTHWSYSVSDGAVRIMVADERINNLCSGFVYRRPQAFVIVAAYTGIISLRF